MRPCAPKRAEASIYRYDTGSAKSGESSRTARRLIPVRPRFPVPPFVIPISPRSPLYPSSPRLRRSHFLTSTLRFLTVEKQRGVRIDLALGLFDGVVVRRDRLDHLLAGPIPELQFTAP